MDLTVIAMGNEEDAIRVCDTLNGYLDQLGRLLARGYVYANTFTFHPDGKLTWEAFVQRMKGKHQPLSRVKHHRRYDKSINRLRAFLVRYKNQFTILATTGDDPTHIRTLEQLSFIKHHPILVEEGGMGYYVGRRDGQATVWLTPKCFNHYKSKCEQVGRIATKAQASKFWRNMTKKMPSFHGLYIQKKQLRDAMVKASRLYNNFHGVPPMTLEEGMGRKERREAKREYKRFHCWRRREFPIENFRRSYPVVDS